MPVKHKAGGSWFRGFMGRADWDTARQGPGVPTRYNPGSGPSHPRPWRMPLVPKDETHMNTLGSSVCKARDPVFS